jgi:tripartite-type tricarboxylate transporter receptor subunit TctC
VIYPSVLKQVPFDSINDITPIAVSGATPLVLAVNPKVPAKDMKELVARLKANPGKYNYGSSGNGTILRFAAKLLQETTQTSASYVPCHKLGPKLKNLATSKINFGVDAYRAMARQRNTINNVTAGAVAPFFRRALL